ncbi:MAG: LuxR C-terminal-related transcriptional regulator, partial [Acidimicrobiia bacterium]
HSFELTAVNATAVAELCRRLDGLPLALELAGARAATLSVGDLTRRLDEGLLDLLHSPLRDAAERADVLRAAIESTCALLHPREMRMLDRLSVLAGSFGLDPALGATGADSVDGDVLDDLSTLVDLHLIDPLDGPNGRRFVVPNTIRAYACEHAEAAGTSGVDRAEFTEWCAATAWRQPERTDEPVGYEAARWVDAEHHLLEDALRDALDRGRAEQVARLVAGLAPYWERHGYDAAAHQLVQQAVELTSSLATKASVQTLTWSAVLGLQYVRDEPALVVRRLERALALAEQLQDTEEELRALSARVVLAPYIGDVEGARVYVEQGLALAGRGGHEDWQARFEVWVGMRAHQTGDLDRAVALGRAAVERARRLGDDRTLVHASQLLLPLVGADRRPGDPSVEEALAAARRAEALHLELSLLPMRVAGVLSAGDEAGAARFAEEALTTARRAPSDPATVLNLMTAAYVLDRLNQPAAAARIHGAVYAQLTALEPYIPPAGARAYNEMLVRVRQTLGATAFDAAVAEAGALSITQCIDETLERLQASLEHRLGAASTERPPADPRDPIMRLTARERDVLNLVIAGRTNREIAGELSLSPKTVMHHTGAIYRKLRVRGRAEAIAQSLRSGM